MRRGRPKDKRFDHDDGLLGLFRIELRDTDVMSCSLVSVPSGKFSLTEQTRILCSRFNVNDGRPLKRKLRDIPIYYAAGSQMGNPSMTAHSGAHAKDIWVSRIQEAQESIRINAYCLSDPDILEALRYASNPPRDVKVRVRYDYRQQGKMAALGLCCERYSNVDVHPVVVSEDERVLMHKKELIVDAEPGAGHPVLVLGSYNPTSSARSNQESACIIFERLS